MMLLHVGHDHGSHHWLPTLIVALAIGTVAMLMLMRRHCRQENDK